MIAGAFTIGFIFRTGHQVLKQRDINEVLAYNLWSDKYKPKIGDTSAGRDHDRSKRRSIAHRTERTLHRHKSLRLRPSWGNLFQERGHIVLGRQAWVSIWAKRELKRTKTRKSIAHHRQCKMEMD